MKAKLLISAISMSLLVLSGCGGGGSSEPDNPSSGTNPTDEPVKVEVDKSLKKYNVTLCDSSNKDSQECADAKDFDLDKERVAILNPPKDIGVSEWSYFDGKRFAVVPKDETKISPMEIMAFGIWIHAQKAGSKWCGPCKLEAPQSYKEALGILKRYNLTGTKEQNEAILWLINKNLEVLASRGLSAKDAYMLVIQELAKNFVNLTVEGKSPDLSHLHLVKDSKGRILGVSSTPDSECNDKLGRCINGWGNLLIIFDEAELYRVNQKNGKLKPHQKAFEHLTCKSNENKLIYMFGVDDNYATTNYEPTNPQQPLLNALNANILNSKAYDSTMNWFDTFGETLTNLPSNMTQGMLAVGYKPYKLIFDPYYTIFNIGLYNQGDYTLFDTSAALSTGWNRVPNTSTYYKNLSSIILNSSGSSLLNKIQNGFNNIDFYSFNAFGKVDYIAVAACVPKPKPTEVSIKEVPVKIKCNAEKGENLVTVWGGNGDDFATPMDNITPPPGIPSGTLKYDEKVDKRKVFIDRVALPSGQITQMQITLNTKGTAPGFMGDFFGIGDIVTGSGYSNSLYNNTLPQVNTLNGGTATILFGTQSGTLLNLANSNHYLDVKIGSHSEVDSIRVNMCVIDEEKGDISITKELGETYDKGGRHYATYKISFTGSLPQAQPLVIDELVPANAVLESINAQSPWVCNASVPLTGAANVQCYIQSSPTTLNPIPPIEILMSTDGNNTKLENCADINEKTENVYYNNNSNNDKDCATAEFKPIDTPPKACSVIHKLDLSLASSWIDPSTGTNPNVNNPVPYAWDNSYSWFNLQLADFATRTLETKEFCVCGRGGYVKIDGMKIDNTGDIQLDNLSNNTSNLVAQQTSNNGFLSSYPAATGFVSIPYYNSGKNYKLKFKITNETAFSGGAVKGKLVFTGHWGRCTKGDYVIHKPPISLEANVSILVDPPVGDFDDNTTITVVQEETKVSSTMPSQTPMPIVVKGKDLIKTDLTPKEAFGQNAPDNFSIIIDCDNAKISVALNQTAPIVYHTNKGCSDDPWIVYLEK